jgi:hypothetical protein
MVTAKQGQMPKVDPHLQYQKWAQEYGGIYSLMLGTKTAIVLSSDKAVKDLLDKRSANYSARPDLYTGQTLMSGDKRMVMMVRDVISILKYETDDYTDVRNALEKCDSTVCGYIEATLTGCQIRKVFHNSLHVNKSAEYVPYQELENKQLLYEMMNDPSTDLLDHFRRYSSSLVTSIVYG